MVFVREDFLLPPSTKVVGPSTVILFHGGDIGRGNVFEVGTVSASFRFFAGGSPSLPCTASSCLTNCREAEITSDNRISQNQQP